MKFLAIFVCFFVYSHALDKECREKFITKLKEIGEHCIPETKATSADVASLMAHELPASHEGKCLIFCYHKALKMQSEDGSLTKEEAIAEMEPLKENDAELYGKLLKIFDTCSAAVAVDSDPCVYAGNLAVCGVKEGKAMGLEDLIMTE